MPWKRHFPGADGAALRLDQRGWGTGEVFAYEKRRPLFYRSRKRPPTMNRGVPLALLAVASLAGVAYSGYLTYVTFLSGVGACENFYFGYPSCFYGFLLYSMVFVFGFMLALLWRTVRAMVVTVLGASGVGFAAFLTGYVLALRSCGSFLIFGVPPCVMGLGMFAVVFLISVSLLMQKQPP